MSRAREDLLAFADWRSRAVLARNALVYLRNWRTAFFPPAMEPLVMFATLGLGLGNYVAFGAGQPHGGVSYASFLGPGLMAYSAFSTPFFEGLYSAYVRMFYQKTWDGLLATQVEMRHVVWGEILWAGLRGAMNVAVVALVLAGLDAAGVVSLHVRWLPLAPLLAFPLGCVCSALALIFTAIVPSIDHMNYPTFLVGVPLGFVSDTYFPVDPRSPTLALLVDLNPVRHFARTMRALLLDEPAGRSPLLLALTVCGWLLVFAAVAHRRVRARVLG